MISRRATRNEVKEKQLIALSVVYSLKIAERK